MVENPGHLKDLDVLGLSSLIHLCNNTWTSGVVPLDWQTGGGWWFTSFRRGNRGYLPTHGLCSSVSMIKFVSGF